MLPCVWAGALPDSQSPMVADGAGSDAPMLPPHAADLVVNLAHSRKFNEWSQHRNIPIDRLHPAGSDCKTAAPPWNTRRCSR